MTSISTIRHHLCLFLLAAAFLGVMLASGTAWPAPKAGGAGKVTASDNLVRYLEAEGVTKVFGVPGEETLHIVDAIRRSPKIKFVLSGNEQGASMMASGYSRATGKMGVALSTLGPGATNMVTGAANALSENVKVMFITGQGPVHRPMGYHQKLDLTQVFKPVTRMSLEAKTASSVVSTARKLVRAAHGNPGPVHLSLPADVAAGMVKRAPASAVKVGRAKAPTAKSVAAAVKMLKAARAPVIVAGDGVMQNNADGTAKAVLAFAKKHGIPVVPSAMAKGMFPWRNKSVLPPMDAFANGKGSDVVRKSDLIFSVGFHPTETFEPKNFNPGGKIPVLHLSGQALPRAHRIKGMNPKVAIKADLTAGLTAMSAGLKGYRAPRNVMSRATLVRNQHHQELKDAARNPGKGQLNPKSVMFELRKALDQGAKRGDKAMVFGDVGLNKGYLTQWLEVGRRGEVMVPNGMSTLGIALPQAVGAKLADPRLKVVSVSGDGGLMMNVQELATAAKHKLPLVHLVLMDKSLGLIENHQRRNALKPSGVDLPGLDVKALAKGLGARGVVVKDARQIAPLVQKALRGNKPTLIGIPVNYAEAHARADKMGKDLTRKKTKTTAKRSTTRKKTTVTKPRPKTRTRVPTRTRTTKVPTRLTRR